MRCLLLTFDCLPRRWIGCYGSLDNATRGFDRLASLGTTFENAISPQVAAESHEIAGFQRFDRQGGPVVVAAGDELRLPIHLIESHDEPPAARKGRKRNPSRLSHELHEACSWMRDQNRPCFAWVRHPGLHVSETPVEHAEPLLTQLAVLDEELDSFMDEWQDCAEDRWTFMLTAGRGVVRARQTVRRRDERRPESPWLTDDLLRVPLMVLEGRGEGFGRRHLELLPTSRLAEAVQSMMTADQQELTRSIRERPAAEAVVVRGEAGEVAIRTEEWLFVRSLEPDREPGDGQLFRKPEDPGDVFDVRSTQADEAIRLDGLIEV